MQMINIHCAKTPFELEYALLGLLRKAPLHAYEVHQRLKGTEVLRLIWRLKQRQVYALLERLEKEGYLVSSIEVQDSRPPKAYAPNLCGATLLAHKPVTAG